MKKSKKIKILFLDILTDDSKLRNSIEKEVYEGKTYAEHMRRAFGLAKDEFVAFDGSSETLPDPAEYDALVMGGSVEDPVPGKEKPWMRKVYALIRGAIKKEVPILGICGGLQFTIRALGDSITLNPKGRELGTVEITLTEAGMRDSLFRGLEKTLMVQESHKCIAKSLPKEGTRLAGSQLCANQTIAIGKRIRLLQFHPEMTQQQLRDLATMRKDALIKEGFSKNDETFTDFVASIENTNVAGKKILKNFITYFVLPRKK